MARQPAASPEPSAKDAKRKWLAPQGLIAAGAVLLLSGAALVTYAMAKPEDKVNVADVPAVPVSVADVSAPTASSTPTFTPKSTGSPSGKTSQRTSSRPRHTVTVRSQPKVTDRSAPKRKAKKPIQAKANTPYLLRNVVTGKCLGKLTFQGAVTQEICDSPVKMQLRKTRVDGGTQLYQLVDSGDTNMCMDPPGRETNPSGTLMSAVPCLEDPTSDNQEWRLKDTGEVSKGRVQYAVVNAASGLCLDVLGLSTDQSDRPAGLSLTLANCTDPSYDDRLWTFS
jgi:ricin-type beta-trefoil lectin protein